MVNTFLTHPNFRVSAASLDRSRLGKQRVEAYQILRILENIHHLALMFNYPYRQDIPLQTYINNLNIKYKNFNVTIEIVNGQYFRYEKNSSHGKVPTTIIKMGFCHHPIVRAWFGYQEALKLYINVHIDEWVKRGYRNTMTKFEVNENVKRPSWTFDSNIHTNHRQSLLAKEIAREEKPWYINQKDFKNVGKFTCYIWPKPESSIVLIINEEDEK